MGARIKIPVVDQKIFFDGSGIFSPVARVKAFADLAGARFEEIDRENAAAIGRVVHYRTFVDNRETANLHEAKETSVILARWELGAGVVSYIWDLLSRSGPVLTGKYRKSARMYADGVEIDDPDNAIGAREVLFLSIVPYARKIQRGKGGYAPGHVYEAVAALANARFSNIAKIRFTFAEPEGPAPELERWAATSPTAAAQRKRKGKDNPLRQPAILVYLT